jgi:glycosyltransferase involved in cell wall biosynthesis
MIEKTEDEIMQNWKSRQDPLLSCCLITYNHEKFISQAIDGMLKQETDFPFEIIIHDDASTDGTVEIIRKYADKYPHIIRTILQKENQYSQKKNIMAIPIKEARGQYIASLEGDDYWIDPLKLQKQVDFLEKNSEYVCCYHNSIVVNDNDEMIKEVFIGAPKDYSRSEMLATSTDITTHSVVFRNVIEYPDDLKEIPFGDMARWHLMGFHGKAKYLDNVEKAAYRVHDNGVWSKLDNYSKFDKTILSKLMLRNNLIKHHLSTKDIDDNINHYIARMLTEALLKKEFLMYGKVVENIMGNKDLSSTKLIILHLQMLYDRIFRKIVKVTEKIFDFGS